AVGVGGGGGAVGRVDRDGPVRVDLGQDALQHLGGVGPDLDADVGRVVLSLADPELLDLVGGPAGQDGVEHLGQEQRVDDVTAHLDVFDVPGGHGGSPGWGFTTLLDTHRPGGLRARRGDPGGPGTAAGAGR